MDAAQTIRQSIADVIALRQSRSQDAALAQAVITIKALQTKRFSGSYQDLLVSPAFGPAARFFLDELYSGAGHSGREQQFGAIAGTLQTVFPDNVVKTAVALATLHVRTERLDHAMAQAWLQTDASQTDALRYVQAWKAVGQMAERQAQVNSVVAMGNDLSRLTRLPGLGLMLRMMRGPASAAGLSELQRFFESGFEIFSRLSRQTGAVDKFLADIAQRETEWNTQLEQQPAEESAARLQALWAR